jgi:HEAT repeat protein
LGSIRDARAVKPLIAALKDGDETIRESAARALGAIKDPQALDPLVAVLEDAAVRQTAASSLGALGDARAIPALSAFDEDTDAGVRKAVLDAKKTLGWRPPPPPIKTLAKEFEAAAQSEGMDYVASRHSPNLLIDHAELSRIVQTSGADAIRHRYGLSDDEIQAVMNYIARGGRD